LQLISDAKTVISVKFTAFSHTASIDPERLVPESPKILKLVKFDISDGTGPFRS
jgi:hypothetical protein